MKQIIAMITSFVIMLVNNCYAYNARGRVFPEDLRDYDYDYSSGGGGGDSSSWCVYFGVIFVVAFFQFLDGYDKGGFLRGIRDALYVPTCISVLSLPVIILCLLYKYGPDKWYEWLALIAGVVIIYRLGKKLLLPKSK